jgi:hypothetical protein
MSRVYSICGITAMESGDAELLDDWRKIVHSRKGLADKASFRSRRSRYPSPNFWAAEDRLFLKKDAMISEKGEPTQDGRRG